MPFFPLFIDLSQKRILVVGGGTVATRKVEKLLPFSPLTLDVVARKCSPEMELLAGEGRIRLQTRSFQIGDIDGHDIVIVAVDEIELQKSIFEICQERKIFCNSVDSPDYCSFIFPALTLRGDVTIGISTGGKAPGLSAHLRRWLDEMLPEELPQILEKVSIVRKTLEHKAIKSFDQRAAKVKAIVEGLLPLEQTNSKKDSPQDPQS